AGAVGRCLLGGSHSDRRSGICGRMIPGIDIRPIRADEVADFGRTFSIAFGETWDPDDTEAWRPTLEVERTLAAFDREKLVATAAIQSFELTLPGLTTTAAA